jgi:hypothetical protein
MNSAILLMLKEKVQHDPYHALSPDDRARIYQAIKATSNAQHTELYLSAISISYIRSIWIQSSIASSMINTLASIQSYLQGGSENIISEMKSLEKFSRKTPLDSELFFSVLGMIRTLDLAAGKGIFNGYPVDADTIDAELGPDHIDPAGCAVAAFAHGLYDEEADPARRLVFWHWWLDSAVPAAFNPPFILP